MDDQNKKPDDFGMSYAVHNDRSVRGFFEAYRFLSNYWPAPTYYEGLLYKSSEAAYQAAKMLPHYRQRFTEIGAGTSKRLWKELGEESLYDQTPDEWDARKYDVMSAVVFDKFCRNRHLRQQLLDTGERFLEETNHWNDIYWGVDIEKGGQNHLGKILMKIRNYWKP